MHHKLLQQCNGTPTKEVMKLIFYKWNSWKPKLYIESQNGAIPQLHEENRNDRKLENVTIARALTGWRPKNRRQNEQETKGVKGTVDPFRDLEKPIWRLPVEEPSEQRHMMALFLPWSDPNRELESKTIHQAEQCCDPKRKPTRSRTFPIQAQTQFCFFYFFIHPSNRPQFRESHKEISDRKANHS